jgi:hypothetical protein
MARWRPTIEIKAGGHQIGSGFLFNRKRDGHAIPTAIITLFRPGPSCPWHSCCYTIRWPTPDIQEYMSTSCVTADISHFSSRLTWGHVSSVIDKRGHGRSHGYSHWNWESHHHL